MNGQSPAEALHKWMVVDNDAPDIYAIWYVSVHISGLKLPKMIHLQNLFLPFTFSLVGPV